jgi:hypothetical protein
MGCATSKGTDVKHLEDEPAAIKSEVDEDEPEEKQNWLIRGVSKVGHTISNIGFHTIDDLIESNLADDAIVLQETGDMVPHTAICIPACSSSRPPMRMGHAIGTKLRPVMCQLVHDRAKVLQAVQLCPKAITMADSAFRDDKVLTVSSSQRYQHLYLHACTPYFLQPPTNMEWAKKPELFCTVTLTSFCAFRVPQL